MNDIEHQENLFEEEKEFSSFAERFYNEEDYDSPDEEPWDNDEPDKGHYLSTLFEIPLVHYEYPGRNSRLEVALKRIIEDKRFPLERISDIVCLFDHKGILRVGFIDDPNLYINGFLEIFGDVWEELWEDCDSVELLCNSKIYTTSWETWEVPLESIFETCRYPLPEFPRLNRILKG